MAPVETGKYVITNARFPNVAFLDDSNVGTPVTAGTFTNKNTARWSVSELSNERFYIKNFGTATEAYTGDGADLGANVEGRSRNQQWVIHETNTQDVYTISTVGSKLYWFLENGDEGTIIVLSDKVNDKRAQWTLSKK